MNKEYFEKYLEFYTGENRKAMYRCFATLVDAIRSDDFSELDNVLTQDCIAEYSTTGKAIGIEKIKEMLKWPGPEVNVKKATIWNYVSRSNKEGKGQQSAYVESVVAIDDGKNIFPFTYGGVYCNSYVKEDEEWKISHIRYDLIYADDNNGFVMNKWALISPELYSGHKPVIVSELDNPWTVIPDDCEKQSDAEEIFELQFKKVGGFDRGDFNLPLSIATEDMQQFSEEPGNRNYVNFLKYKQHKEPNLMHANRMGNVIINGNEAYAIMPRGEEHRLRDRVYTRENIHSMVTTGDHRMWAEKIDGVWKLKKIGFGGTPSEEIRFIPMPDDVIAFDEYVLGRSCNEDDFGGY